MAHESILYHYNSTKIKCFSFLLKGNWSCRQSKVKPWVNSVVFDFASFIKSDNFTVYVQKYHFEKYFIIQTVQRTVPDQTEKYVKRLGSDNKS